MAAATDPTEISLGICSFISKARGFSAVLKGRYSDFIVHEGEFFVGTALGFTDDISIALIDSYIRFVDFVSEQ